MRDKKSYIPVENMSLSGYLDWLDKHPTTGEPRDLQPDKQILRLIAKRTESDRMKKQ